VNSFPFPFELYLGDDDEPEGDFFGFLVPDRPPLLQEELEKICHALTPCASFQRILPGKFGRTRQVSQEKQGIPEMTQRVAHSVAGSVQAFIVSSGLETD